MDHRPKIFISYSHEDEVPWKNFVVSHLRVAEYQGEFELWDDRGIPGGSDWKAEISSALSKASIAILLISRHSLSSDFILTHEIPIMLERRAREGLLVYPILLTDCNWKTVDALRTLNVRPVDGAPLAMMAKAKREKAMSAIAKEISELIQPTSRAKTISQLAPALATPTIERSRLTRRQISVGVSVICLAGVLVLALRYFWEPSTSISAKPVCSPQAEYGLSSCESINARDITINGK